MTVALSQTLSDMVSTKCEHNVPLLFYIYIPPVCQSNQHIPILQITEDWLID